MVQAGVGKHRKLPNVPNVMDYIKTEEGRKLFRVASHSPQQILRAFSLPPGTPKDRVKILRKAFMATMKDPELLAEAEKAKLVIDPITGEQVVKAVDELLDLKPDLAVRLKEILVPTR